MAMARYAPLNPQSVEDSSRSTFGMIIRHERGSFLSFAYYSVCGCFLLHVARNSLSVRRFTRSNCRYKTFAFCTRSLMTGR